MSHKHRILISEDDEDLTQRWQKSLQHESFLVDVAHDGETALKKWEKYPYDIILLDLITPKIKGGELTQRIKNKQPWTQIIIVSGQGKEQDKLEAIKQHVFDYLEKPVKFEVLLTTIQQALEKRDLILRGVETMLLDSSEPNKNIIIIGEEAYSAQRLFDEVRLGTKVGCAYRQSREQEVLKEDSIRKSGFRMGGMIE
jgi:DNA-binding response OmpR family regulator